MAPMLLPRGGSLRSGLDQGVIAVLMIERPASDTPGSGVTPSGPPMPAVIVVVRGVADGTVQQERWRPGIHGHGAAAVKIPLN